MSPAVGDGVCMLDTIKGIELIHEGEGFYLVFVGKQRTIFRLIEGTPQMGGHRYKLTGFAPEDTTPLNIEGVKGTKVTLASNSDVVFRNFWIAENFVLIYFGLVRFWTKGLEVNPEEPLGPKVVLEVDGIMPLNLM